MYLPLRFRDDDMWKIMYGIDLHEDSSNHQYHRAFLQHHLYTTNVTEGFADAKITTSNGFDWQSPANNGSHNAHLHVINDVLLPIPGFKTNLTGEASCFITRIVLLR